jgi:hypothetical protein
MRPKKQHEFFEATGPGGMPRSNYEREGSQRAADRRAKSKAGVRPAGPDDFTNAGPLIERNMPGKDFY